MIDLVRLHHASFAVKDLAASKHFFSDVVGLQEIERPQFSFPGAWYQLGDRQVHLIEQKSAGREVSGRISRSDHLAFEVVDVDAVKQTLEAAGIPYQTGGNEALGFAQVFCSDPDGHTIEFVRYD